MAEIARRATAKHNRILFVVHRKEIVDQVVATFKAQDVDMSLAKIGMVQTITRHVNDLEEPAIIFVDEAHHALAKSYRRILDKFPNALKLLFTATPYRLDGKGFDDIADDLILGNSIKQLIKDGFLAPVDYYAPVQLDVSQLKTKRNGEFDEKSVEQAFKPKVYGNAVKTFRKLAGNKQAIAYTYNVASAERLADELNHNGVVARAVSGNTPKDERNSIIKDYRNGKIQVVTNAELFTEGLDLPNVDCVIMLRPTQSLSLYLQFAMRCMNPRKGKTAIIIDHVGNVNRFGLPTQPHNWTLDGKDKSKSNDGRSDIKPVTTCPMCFATFYRKGDKCPFCGAELTEEKVLEVVEEAKLEKVKEERIRKAKLIMEDNLTANVADKKASELKSFEEIRAFGKFKGYKPGWSYFYAKKRGFIK
ncbi:helicase [Companilactobacillus mindensis DSM 14500]|uniref:Helicase n=1 Tax=Companilactobacillus mindensis DSM 14500 TaxID=1423770 RepID=A0A0R1QXQ4_9LACO|nr:DEAD/DEAH box helicase [Companilactobacillus mindensis]KRL45987.1 helicase [Companilactobacillus mindensis DSM 14500]GEO78116.1 DEAD/DEAH box helicase [Companilactobacillus mindensis]